MPAAAGTPSPGRAGENDGAPVSLATAETTSRYLGRRRRKEGRAAGDPPRGSSGRAASEGPRPATGEGRGAGSGRGRAGVRVCVRGKGRLRPPLAVLCPAGSRGN